MRIFPPPLQIGDTDGFTEGVDIFNRVQLGRGLTNLVSNVSDPIVLAVDGQWGSGKTTFLKMWIGELRKGNFPVIYFDAFQNDYSEDAFTALASQIVALANSKQRDAAKTKVFLEKAVGAGKVLLRSSLKLGIKAATLGALNGADLDDVATALADEASELEDKYIGELLTRQEQQQDAIEGFRQALADLPALLSIGSSHQQASSAERPLVIVIDELDRCRPLFALEILERIKHFFSVPNVHFVLGTHLGQLQNSVRVAYGGEIDAQTYLQKFIHLTLHLMDEKQHRRERITTKYIDYLVRVLEFKPEDRECVIIASALIHHVAEAHRLSLRAIERIMTVLAISLAYRPINAMCPETILAGLCILRVTAPEQYVQAKAGTADFGAIHQHLALNIPPDTEDKAVVEHVGRFWQYCLLQPDPGPELRQRYDEAIARYDIDRRRIVPLVANSIVDRLTPR
jgi:KAP family P-loop domain